MLVLKRNNTQSITCILPSEEQLVISLHDIGNGHAQVGIEAPREVAIVRSELLDDAIVSDNELAQIVTSTQKELLAYPS